MPESGVLVGIAQIAVVFAGLGGISVVLGRRQVGEWTFIDAVRVNSMVALSLLGGTFALVPLVLRGLDVASSLTWGLSSIAFGIALLMRAIRLPRLQRRLEGEHQQEMPSLLVNKTLNVATVVVPVLLIGDGILALLGRGVGAYMVGLFWTLVFPGYLFVQSMTRIQDVLRESAK